MASLVRFYFAIFLLRKGSIKKIQTLKIRAYYILLALKHVIWRFRICNYFCEISKFRDFMNTLRNFAKSVSAHISAKFKYFAKQFKEISRSCALK